jgi:P pilus assembly chaperone PapD
MFTVFAAQLNKKISAIETKCWAKSLVFALGLAFAVSSQASIKISPVRPVIESNTKSTSLTLQNGSDSDKVFDVRVMAWKNQDAQGNDQLEPTVNVVSSLPVVKIPANESFIIRLVVRQQTEVAVSLQQIMLPLFVMNDTTSSGKLSLQNGVVSNVGGRTVRLTEWKDKSGKVQSGLRYLLPGKSMNLNIVSLESVKFNDEMY